MPAERDPRTKAGTRSPENTERPARFPRPCPLTPACSRTELRTCLRASVTSPRASRRRASKPGSWVRASFGSCWARRPRPSKWRRRLQRSATWTSSPERGVVSVPSGRIPVDLSSFRLGPALTDDLAHRDFTVLAMAYRPATAELLDPYGGQRDLEARELRGVNEPSDRFAEDPARMLRAARLVSEYALAPQPDLEEAIANGRD